MAGKDFRFSCYGLIRNARGEYLLLQRASKSKHFAGQWELSGGKPEPGETLPQTLLREANEETRLGVSLDGFAGAVEFAMPGFQAVMIVMRGLATSDSVVLSDEHDAYRWVPRDQLLQMGLTPQLRRFLAAYLAQTADGGSKVVCVPSG